MLTQPCHILPGVGAVFAEKLAKCGIVTIQDLLFHLPYRYQDRTRITPICDLRANDWCVVSGIVSKTEVKLGKRRSLYCYIEDKTGQLRLRFFHFNQQQVHTLNSQKLIRVFGEIRVFSNQLEMIHPEYHLYEKNDDCPVEETLTPIYPSTQGLSQNRLRQLIKTALTLAQENIHELEWMSTEQRLQYQFPSLHEALELLHNPPPDISVQQLEEGSHPARKRVAFDELLAHQLSMQFARKQRATLCAPSLPNLPEPTQAFLSTLPFHLTKAQERVTREISVDLSHTKPMLRLVQGDVGAGKTVIAALATLQAAVNGFQVAIMAPTEILCEQHYQHFKHWFEPCGFSVMRLSGKMTTSERKKALEAIATNQCRIVVGTHALFQEAVVFAQLALVIIDEQHRFGVEQRLQLHQKGQQERTVPHQLLMTATPIPRTLAMSQFSHLDLSTLDELPPGRTPVTTAVMNQDKREPVIARLQYAIAQGRQAYWVCTLIEESEKLQCIAASDTQQHLQTQLPNTRIGLIHGRMKSSEKEHIMQAFKQGNLDILVATTVIEVGVDVANASLMIIENAERLGLSQLHQLRGRVGRGSTQAHCLLLYQPPLSAVGYERLKIMRATTDGFIIAEKDLALRGSGDILGTRQTGYRVYRIADLTKDYTLLPSLKIMASELVQHHSLLAEIIAKRWLGHYESYIQA